MKESFAIAAVIILTVTPTTSFADHLEPKDSEIRPSGDLAHTNLNGTNLSGANLSGANLKRAVLKDAELTGADLNSAFLGGANLKRAVLKDADLRGANLNSFTATNLRGCPTSLPNGWVCENRSLIRR